MGVILICNKCSFLMNWLKSQSKKELDTNQKKKPLRWQRLYYSFNLRSVIDLFVRLHFFVFRASLSTLCTASFFASATSFFGFTASFCIHKLSCRLIINHHGRNGATGCIFGVAEKAEFAFFSARAFFNGCILGCCGSRCSHICIIAIYSSCRRCFATSFFSRMTASLSI